jgi:cytochrome b561
MDLDVPPASIKHRHPWPTIALHWLTVLAIVVAASAIWWREAAHERAWRDALLTLHRHAGWLVLPLLAARLVSRLGWRTRVGDEDSSTVLRMAGAAAHGLLYLCLALLPMAGWLLSNARGQVVVLFGRWPLPALIEPDPDLADVWKDRHEALAWALAALVTAHVLAALWHHFIRRDGVLRSMWPRGTP